MSLLYKDDWEETKERYKSWWAGEYFGRCAMAVGARRDDAPDEEPPEAPDDPEDKWTNLEYWAAHREWSYRRSFYGGEAFPIWSCGYPGHKRLAAFLGCPVSLGESTGWVDPILDGDEWDVTQLRIDPENERWKFAVEALEFAAHVSRGKAIPSIGAFGGSGDTLAAVRGSDKLLLDCVDCPEKVREADQYLMDRWIECYETFYAIINEAAEGSTFWMGLWSPGKAYAPQNDFAYMISPDMYRDVFLPTVRKQTAFLDHAVYHVDGEGCFSHVDALLEEPDIQCLQILPGAGKPSPLHYTDVLKKVQDAGKNLHISIPATGVKQALEQLSAKGLFIVTSCETESEARELLANAERWSAVR
jgi:hypothetical protein